jgi:hypothetical protein
MEGDLYKYPTKNILKSGLEVQKPTHAIKSVKGPGNTFDLSPKWARTLPSLIYFSWDTHSRVSNINFDI